jgi:glyoxylase-like metal-dependent hydrolase (beta-lactamase superfamily II)
MSGGPLALRFDIVQKGLIDISQTEGIKDSRPTSSLITSSGLRLLIDTEHPKEDGTEFRAALAALGVAPRDVGAVLFTHLHPDHMGHKDMFPGAVFIFHREDRFGFYFDRDRTTRLAGDALLDLIPEGILSPRYTDSEPDLRALGDSLYLKHIPGHTQGSLAIFACIGGKVQAFVGDTFLNKGYYDRWEPPGSSWNKGLIYTHMEYVKKKADIIIPGHGGPFEA